MALTSYLILKASLYQGNVGQRSSASGYSIYISKLIARPGTEFKVVRRSTETAVELLRRVFIAKERGKKSGIVEVTLNGPEQEKIGLILDEILKTYVRQNVNKRSAEAEKTLKFLENQLPNLKKEMETAEATYNSYRQSRGSLDLNIETQGYCNP
jgi:tyrosine-protein kinase Etk/Wzc